MSIYKYSLIDRIHEVNFDCLISKKPSWVLEMQKPSNIISSQQRIRSKLDFTRLHDIKKIIKI